jgi:hypothetical protein
MCFEGTPLLWGGGGAKYVSPGSESILGGPGIDNNIQYNRELKLLRSENSSPARHQSKTLISGRITLMVKYITATVSTPLLKFRWNEGAA